MPISINRFIGFQMVAVFILRLSSYSLSEEKLFDEESNGLLHRLFFSTPDLEVSGITDFIAGIGYKIVDA